VNALRAFVARHFAAKEIAKNSKKEKE